MRKRIAVLGTSLLVAGLAACGGGGNDSGKAATTGKQGPAANQPVAASSTTVKITNSELGPILTDQAGRTLYAFTKDTGGASNCTGQCIATWPALTTGKGVMAGDGV